MLHTPIRLNPTSRSRIACAAVFLVVAASAWLESEAPPTHRRTTQDVVWNIVALGDSATTGEGDPMGLGWVERYARLLQQRLGVKVVVTNLAQSGQTSRALASMLRSDPPTQGAVATAEIVLIGIGGADLVAGDARRAAGMCKAEACYASGLFDFRGNIETIAGAVRHVLRSPDVVLRAITLPNVVPGANGVVSPFVTQEMGVYRSKALRRSICRAMAMYRGRCIDVFRVFNGPEGTQNAYAKGWLSSSPCCYPSATGHQVIAELVLKSGFASPG